ncbi:MFS transporter [Granulicoccus sp. GXG6511]|uniref:MFS transporter n=1 Tax=Granulicoccus sp. GXG6511 TaxID=3381351 RepID=UPI003D7DD035
MSSSATASAQTVDYKGNDKVLVGIICGVLTYWLFAQTTYNVAPSMQKDLHFQANLMSIAIAITALVCGILIVVMGGLADRFGRVRMAIVGNILGLAGSLMLALAPTGAGGPLTDLNEPLSPNAVTLPLLFAARAIQGLSAACIMPATLAIVKAYWHGAGRQRAVSLWSIGSWGGASIASFFAGFVEQTPVLGWRAIFFVSAIFSVISILLIRGVPETKAASTDRKKFDVIGLILFMVGMVALQIWMTQGSTFGWASVLAIGLLVAAVVFLFGFCKVETSTKNTNPFIDFRLFKNRTFAGCTLSNMLLNGTASGMVLVSAMLLQTGGTLNALQAGNLTIGYAVGLIVFIRLGEKLLQIMGPRKSMIIGCVIAGSAIVFLLPTNLMESQYVWFATIAYSLYGIGVGIYATPSTDTALATLPDSMGGAGAGLYKMSSTIGGAFGLAISSAVYLGIRGSSALGGDGVGWLAGLIQFVGRQDNVANREGAMVALAINVVMMAVAVIAIVVTVPKDQKALD